MRLIIEETLIGVKNIDGNTGVADNCQGRDAGDKELHGPPACQTCYLEKPLIWLSHSSSIRKLELPNNFNDEDEEGDEKAKDKPEIDLEPISQTFYERLVLPIGLH